VKLIVTILMTKVKNFVIDNGDFIICGIVGAAGQLTYPAEKAFKTLLLLDALRGIDSTGIAAIGRGVDPNSIVAKQVGNPYDLLDMPITEKIFKRINSVLIGHNRFATSGDSNRKNAHPFEFDTLVGCHNGTLTNKYQIPESVDFKVDSQALYNHMSKHGVRSTLDIIQGAWSLVWFDYNNHTLNFLRNKERPMYITYDKKINAIYWASEKWMLHIATSRSEMEIEEPFSTKEDSHYSFHIAPNGEVSEPEVVEMKAKPPAVVHYQSPAWNQHLNRQLPANNVVEIGSKNERVDPSSAASSGGTDLSFANSKGVLLRVMAEGRDEHGAKYVMCFCQDRPGVHIRLFLSKNDKVESFLNSEIVADIGKYHKIGNSTVYGYFKVDYGSVRRAIKPDVPELFKTHKGEMVTKEEWEKQYGECVWCGSGIFAGDKHGLTSCGQAICSGCIDDEEVTQYVSIVSRVD
jgi:glucosamine 6-phosphate synthetase-like amidotransferase/phosphosugar isomerase protein